MQLAWSSNAALAMAPLQDLLNSGGDSRMNTPGRADGNWQWRCTEGRLSQAPFNELLQLTETSARAPVHRQSAAVCRLETPKAATVVR